MRPFRGRVAPGQFEEWRRPLNVGTEPGTSFDLVPGSCSSGACVVMGAVVVDPRKLRRRDVPEWSVARWVRWRYCWWLPMRSEFRWAYYDLRALLAGGCNDLPAGGHGHWRCELHRGHVGMHRFVNYVWSRDGLAIYLPIPEKHLDRAPRCPWAGRHLGPSYWRRVRDTRRSDER